jgi:competence/damage-inducible protein CinA-like protein
VRAAIVAVGSELLGSTRAETNSLRLAALLHRHGVSVTAKSVAGDDVDEVAVQVAAAAARHGLLIVSGGLGPTADDVTREGVAAALGLSVERDAGLAASLERRFRAMGVRMPANNLRQADVLAGATVLANPLGSAPGQRLEAGGCTLFLLPGVPSELEAMALAEIEPWLAANTEGGELELGCLKVACMAESALDERLEPFYREHGSEALTILASRGDLTLLLEVSGEREKRRDSLNARLSRLRGLLGDAVYGERVEHTLERVVGEALAAAGATVVTAESCTGGLVAERLTKVPGSSAYFLGSLVAYSNRLKTALMGVSPEVIERSGAVSAEVVAEMASGARRRLEADYAVAVSGIAGPGGATEGKPVGTVYLAAVGPDGGSSERQLRLPGDRDTVRWIASQHALEMIRRLVLGLPPGRRGAPDGSGR